MIFKIADGEEGDGKLTVEEFQGLVKGIQEVYDAADKADGNEDGYVTAQ